MFFSSLPFSAVSQLQAPNIQKAHFLSLPGAERCTKYLEMCKRGRIHEMAREAHTSVDEACLSHCSLLVIRFVLTVSGSEI